MVGSNSFTDEAAHEVQIDSEEAGSPNGNQLETAYHIENQPPIALTDSYE